MTKYKLAAIGEPTTILSLSKTFCSVMSGKGVYDPLFEFPDDCIIVPAGNGDICISVEVVTKYAEQTLQMLESVFKEKIFSLDSVRSVKLYKKQV